MKPIKGLITKKMVKKEKEMSQTIDGEDRVRTETINTWVDVKTYYTEEDEGYESINYDPKQGGRLFDNEEQAVKAGFIRIGQ